MLVEFCFMNGLKRYWCLVDALSWRKMCVSLFHYFIGWALDFCFSFISMFSWQVKLYGSRKKKSNFFYDYCNTVFYGLYIVKQYCIFHTCTTLQEFGSYTDSFHWEQEFEPCSLGIVLVVGYVHTIEKIKELHKDLMACAITLIIS